MYERGDREPSYDDVTKLANALNIDLTFLLTGNDPAHPFNYARSDEELTEDAEYLDLHNAVSRSGIFNKLIMADVITVFEEMLQKDEQELPPEKKSKFIILMYEEMMEKYAQQQKPIEKWQIEDRTKKLLTLVG